MIEFSNGRKAEYFVASGALAFRRGWFWEVVLVWLGLIKLRLFAVTIKSLTLKPRKGNLRWWKPWTCVKLIRGGAVNKVGLTNKGFDWWVNKVAPKIDFKNQRIIVSLFGTKDEIAVMLPQLDQFELVAVEINYSCPNSGHGKEQAKVIIRDVSELKSRSRHPFILKLSADQDYLAISFGLRHVIEAISINSVPWEIVFPGLVSLLRPLELRVKGGGGGVSGRPAQALNWDMVKKLSDQGAVPVIAPSVMSYEDVLYVRSLGAQAVSFGTIHLPDHDWWWRRPWTVFTNPCKPTKIALRDIRTRAKQPKGQ